MNHFLTFQSENQVEFKNLILAAFAVHWDTLNTDKNPDLNGISHSYADAFFWLHGKIKNRRVDAL